jgi:Ger(x)C family germination protein
MRQQVRIIAVSLLLVSILSGCASNRPLNDRALVMVMAFSPGPRKEMTIAFQIPTPQGLTSLTSAGSGGTGSIRQTTYAIYGHGKTIAQAFSEAQARVNQDLYFGQLQAVVLSTQLSKSQFGAISSFLTRIGQVDKTAFALATTTPVKQFMATTPSSTPLSSLYYTSEFGCSQCQSVDLVRRVWNIEKNIYSPTESLWLPLITSKGDGFQIAQMVFYREKKAAAILTPQQTVVLGYLLGKTAKGTLSIPWHGELVSIRRLRSKKPGIRVQWAHGHLMFRTRLHISGSVEGFPPEQWLGPQLPQLERAISVVLAERVVQVLDTLTQRKIDPLDVGSAYLWQHPDALARWNQAFTQASWSISVTVGLTVLGDTT